MQPAVPPFQASPVLLLTGLASSVCILGIVFCLWEHRNIGALWFAFGWLYHRARYMERWESELDAYFERRLKANQQVFDDYLAGCEAKRQAVDQSTEEV